MVVASRRFGNVEVADDAVVEFPHGLVGLGGRRYALLATGERPAFVWLQSLEDPSLALPLVNPWRFFADYEVELSDADAGRLAPHPPEETAVYVTVRAAQRLEDCTANLRAPIVIAGATGHQVINQAHDAPVRAPLLDSLAA